MKILFHSAIYEIYSQSKQFAVDPGIFEEAAGTHS